MHKAQTFTVEYRFFHIAFFTIWRRREFTNIHSALDFIDYLINERKKSSVWLHKPDNTTKHFTE